MDWPGLQQMDETIEAFSKLGVKVMITELDMDMLPAATRSQAAEVSMNFALRAELNPYTNGLPAAVQQQLANGMPICSRCLSNTMTWSAG